MNYEIMQELLEFERGLKVGDEVSVRWTWSGGRYTARAEVIRLNEWSIRCKLLEDVSAQPVADDGWSAGSKMTFPRLFSDTHSDNNGVFLPERKETDPSSADRATDFLDRLQARLERKAQENPPMTKDELE